MDQYWDKCPMRRFYEGNYHLFCGAGLKEPGSPTYRLGARHQVPCSLFIDVSL